MGKITHSDGRGNYIVLEGGEHLGKTTQSGLLASRLRKLGISTLEVREPGYTPLGNEIRSLLLAKDYEGMAPETELLLFAAQRAELFEKEIVPALRRGDQIISDRSYISAEAYQGHGRGMDLGMIRDINNIATKGIKPDLAFIFDMSIEKALNKKMEKDRIELAGIEFHQRVREGFLEIAAQNPDFCVLIERKDKSIEEVHEEIYKHILPLIKQ